MALLTDTRQNLLPKDYWTALDPMTRQRVLVRDNRDDDGELDETYTILGPWGECIMGQQGAVADVSPDGCLKAADWGGPPVQVMDATGADAYVALLVAPREFRHMHVHVATNPVLISIDGGVTNAFGVAAGCATFDGVHIPQGADIRAINLTAASNYTALYVSLW